MTFKKKSKPATSPGFTCYKTVELAVYFFSAAAEDGGK